MTIKYIGKTHNLIGKPLWEILGNLKHHGVGRMVIRSNEKVYSETCYMRILKVVALPDTSKHFHDPRNVMVLVDKVFRGKRHPEPFQIDYTSYKPDYILIPKDQEENYTKRTEIPPQKIMPRTTDLPVLLKEILIRQAKQEKRKNPDLRLELIYNMTGFKNYRVAEEGETPTAEISLELDRSANPSLYANIKEENTS
ncbi:hypothetical protein WH47_06505 [Habropoda laboriosa]|uniref:28S ribosomal protein S34, mitochondrial n=1 Tax=Habropoda laboriosa TaxID=597456 RepID=A0A0L7RCY1_9HYME|nr:PREDICTED: uncharacterized protein LOC108579692 [Habropoda laboriosa]XP_017798768.1 PREDICTED: uncharacterized protein LOC108579692 [Habropoda laboriosa]KOC68713.1 hypothetical protein WH47_06505 [Habropoda laboriosa]